jgi:hypothetical protein
MALPNSDPIFTKVPNIGSGIITAQQVSTGRGDGTGTVGTDIFKCFTAGAQGSFVKEARIKAIASAAAATGVATSIRIFWSTVGSGSTTPTDTHLLTEVAIPALTSLVGATASASPDFIVPLNFAIPSGAYIHAGSGAAMGTNCSWQVTTIGGDY